MTREQSSGLMRLLLRWPERRDIIIQATNIPKILEFYAAYELAWRAMAYWSNVTDINVDEILNDYRLIISDLEDEIGDLLLTAEICVALSPRPQLMD